MEHKYKDRLWSRVDKKGPDDCWPWMGGCANGYGVLTINYKTISASRMAWSLANNRPAPKGVEIHNTCGNTRCCNPAHLFLATLEERFKRSYQPGKPDMCWIWQGATIAAGYGVLNRKGKIYYAHRLAWKQTNGPIPEGLDILHTCDNPACVNPNHLFLGTQADNMKDKGQKGRARKGQAHHNTKLTEEMIPDIRFELELGVPATTIAKRRGVTRHTIMDIKHGRTWKHVD